MSSAAPGLPFVSEGVSADVVRAGEPRLRRHTMRDSLLPQLSVARLRAPWQVRGMRPVSS